MTRTLNTLAVSLGLLITLAPGTTWAEDRFPRTKADVDKWIVELSNWGRWGKDDQMGALNLITPEKRKQAAKLVREGICVSLARDAEKDRAPDNPSPFEHVMLLHGGTEGPWASDKFSVAYHGFVHTHIDALCHLSYNGKIYNGFLADRVSPEGAEVLDVNNVKDGIFTRGILVDLPLARGKRFLEPRTAIYPEDLEAWEEHAKVKVSSGDVLLIYTGRWARRETMGAWDADKQGAAGLHASCAKWLKQRDIAILGSDAASDVMPSGIDGIDFPIHLLMLHPMGVHILDNCDLEALAKTARKLGRWEFLLTVAPLPVGGGTGSPLNPIATF